MGNKNKIRKECSEFSRRSHSQSSSEAQLKFSMNRISLQMKYTNTMMATMISSLKHMHLTLGQSSNKSLRKKLQNQTLQKTIMKVTFFNKSKSAGKHGRTKRNLAPDLKPSADNSV